MAKLTEKNTKAQILDAYEAALKTIEEFKTGKTSTAQLVKEKEVKTIKESAKQIVEMNILDAAIISKYNDLLKAIELLEEEIQELHGIKKEAESLEALLNANKDAKIKVVKEHEEKIADLNKEFAEKKAENDKIIADLESQYKKMLVILKAEYQEEKTALDKERKREKEEYAYNLQRERAIENDKWEDEKTARENELAHRVQDVAERELTMDSLKTSLTENLALVETLQEEKVDEYNRGLEEGKAKAKKEAETSKGFADRAHKIELERKDDRIAALESNNAKLESQVAELQAKLDAASTRVQEMAIKVAENSGVRMVESSSK